MEESSGHTRPGLSCILAAACTGRTYLRRSARQHNPGFATLFETLGNIPRSEVRHVIRVIPGDALVAAHLAQSFGDKVVVDSAFRELTGHTFHRAFRTARPGKE